MWLKKISYCIATSCYLGYFPVASGTAGTLGGVLIYILWWRFSQAFWLYALLTLVLFLVGVYVSTFVERECGEKDPGIVVIDEVVGFLVTMALIPFTWYWLLIGFTLNRILDIMKPFPANWAQNHLKEGWGIMLDDVISSFYAHIILRLCLLVLNTIEKSIIT
ncbi:MAG: phosphatidylglycerophosphatase A [Chlamydiota bacterium]|nr:phosphatidylglycerophosphatase A [Chlamydiota bacterium]